MHTIAGYRLSTAVVDTFRLDGGAMFGSIPKTLWEKKIPADAQNRILLACRVLYAEGYGRKVLIDLGMGRKWDEKSQGIFAINESGVPHAPEKTFPDITDIILTHLHFDHAGGISRKSGDGRIELTFPSAKILLQQKNWDHAHSPGIRERASYLSENIAPLEHASMVLLDGIVEVLPQITVHPVHGHTPGLQWVKIGSGPGTVAFPADLIPTAHHIDIPYVMGYDLCAETTMREKNAFLEQAVREQWIVVFEHDLQTPAARIGKDARGRFTIAEPIHTLEATP